MSHTVWLLYNFYLNQIKVTSGHAHTKTAFVQVANWSNDDNVLWQDRLHVLKSSIHLKDHMTHIIWVNSVFQVALKRQQALEEQGSQSTVATPSSLDRSKPSDLTPATSNIQRTLGHSENWTPKYDHFGLMKKLFPNQTESVTSK